MKTKQNIRSFSYNFKNRRGQKIATIVVAWVPGAKYPAYARGVSIFSYENEAPGVKFDNNKGVSIAKARAFKALGTMTDNERLGADLYDRKTEMSFIRESAYMFGKEWIDAYSTDDDYNSIEFKSEYDVELTKHESALVEFVNWLVMQSSNKTVMFDDIDNIDEIKRLCLMALMILTI